MTRDTHRIDMAHTLQPYPFDAPQAAPIDDTDELARILLARHLSPHAGVSAGPAGAFRYAAAHTMWTPVEGVHAAHEAIVRWRGELDIIRLTPDDDDLHAYDGVAEDIGLLRGFRLPMEQLLAEDRGKTLVLSSPNGISGQIAPLQDVIRLIRHFSFVVIDERLASFSLRRLSSLVLEWENVVYVHRLPFIMPGQTHDLAWLTHPSLLREDIEEHTAGSNPFVLQELMHYGGTDTSAAERYIARLKSELFRELRKLSVVSVPYPSWSNSLLARIERGNREDIVARLAASGIDVYAPPHANLRQHIRITATSSEDISTLKQALIAINLEL